MTQNLQTMADSNPVRSVPQTPCSTLKPEVKAEIERLRVIAGDVGGFPNAAYRQVALTPDHAPSIRAAVDDLDTRQRPANVQAVRQLLGWLSHRVTWPNELQDPAAAKRNAEMLAEELAELPYEAIARAVRAYPKRCKFWPSALADLYEPAEREAKEMRRLQTNLSVLAKAADRGPDDRQVGNTTYYDPAAATRHREQRVDRGGFQQAGKAVRT